jgi:hypothetical protein
MHVKTLLEKYQANECSSEEQDMIVHYIIYDGITPIDQLLMQPYLDELRLRTLGAYIKTTKIIPLARIPALAAAIAILMGTGVMSRVISSLSFSTSLKWSIDVKTTKLIEGPHFEVKEKRKQELLGTKDVGSQDKDLTPKAFGGMMYRSQKLSDELSVFETTGDIHFKVEGRK